MSDFDDFMAQVCDDVVNGGSGEWPQSCAGCGSRNLSVHETHYVCMVCRRTWDR